MKESAITLLSGGLDSAVATLIAGKSAQIKLAVTFDYGQRAAAQEIKAARAFCKHYGFPHEVILLNWLAKLSKNALTDKNKALPQYFKGDLDKDINKEKKSAQIVWVANRNAVFVNIAAAFAESYGFNQIITGFNAEEAQTFPDNSNEFIDAQNKLLSYSTLSHPKITNPLQKINKTQIAKKAIQLDLNPEYFWSCYDGSAKMCGTCESCARTIRAFNEINALEFIANKYETPLFK